METKFPHPEILLFTLQVLLILIVVCVSLLNLTNNWGNQNLWTVILTGSIGYIMPNPRFKNKFINGGSHSDGISQKL